MFPVSSFHACPNHRLKGLLSRLALYPGSPNGETCREDTDAGTEDLEHMDEGEAEGGSDSPVSERDKQVQEGSCIDSLQSRAPSHAESNRRGTSSSPAALRLSNLHAGGGTAAEQTDQRGPARGGERKRAGADEGEEKQGDESASQPIGLLRMPSWPLVPGQVSRLPPLSLCAGVIVRAFAAEHCLLFAVVSVATDI